MRILVLHTWITAIGPSMMPGPPRRTNFMPNAAAPGDDDHGQAHDTCKEDVKRGSKTWWQVSDASTHPITRQTRSTQYHLLRPPQRRRQTGVE
jgi:hypothetical protein